MDLVVNLELEAKTHFRGSIQKKKQNKKMITITSKTKNVNTCNYKSTGQLHVVIRLNHPDCRNTFRLCCFCKPWIFLKLSFQLHVALSFNFSVFSCQRLPRQKNKEIDSLWYLCTLRYKCTYVTSFTFVMYKTLLHYFSNLKYFCWPSVSHWPWTAVSWMKVLCLRRLNNVRVPFFLTVTLSLTPLSFRIGSLFNLK